MDVGQVKFSVKADGLDAALKAAEKLQAVLNGIDGKKVNAMGKAVQTAANKATKASKAAQSEEDKITKSRIAAAQKYARLNQKHQDDLAKANHKYSEARIKEAIKTGKRVAKVEKELRSAQEKANNEEIRNNMKMQNLKIQERLKTSKRLAKINREDKRAEEEAARAAREAYNAPYQFQKERQRNIAYFGSQMQSLGHALQSVSMPFQNIMRGFTMGIGYRMLYKVMDSVHGAFSRYDTITTYAKVLNRLGIDATKKFSIAGEQATDVYHNLENAVLGLPTGIDEIIESMRRYAGATGEAEKATKLAIAANNAYIAGHMGEREKLFTERQLVALAGGATLSSNQWDSLRRNAPLAIKVVAKEMKMGVQEMIDSLKQGKVSGQEFLDVFIKAGTEGKIKDAAQEMKMTWDAVSQNFQNRMNAMGENILHALNDVFEKMDGRNFLQHVLGVDKKGNYIGGGIRGLIDDMSKSAQEWIRTNPDIITNFFKNLSQINWKGLISGFVQFTISMGRFYAFLGKIVGSGNLVRFMLDLGLLGKALTVGGGFIRGTAWLSAWLMTIKKFGLMGGAGKAIKNGAELASGHGAIVGATRTVATAAMTWQQVASKAVTVAAIPAMAWAFKEVSLGLQELAKVDMSRITPAKFGAIALAIGELTTIATVIGHLTATNAFGWVTAAGMAIGTAEIAAISKTMKWVGEGLNAIADAKIPDAGKIGRIMSTMNEISKHFESKNIFESIGKIFDAWTKTSEFKAVKNATDAFKGITDMVSMKLPKGWRDKATERFDAVMDFVGDIEFMVSGLDTRLMARANKAKGKFAGSQKGTSKAKTNANAYDYIKQQLRDFAEQMQSIADGFTYLNTALLAAKKFNKIYANLNHLKKGGYQPFSFDTVFYQVERFAKEIYRFTQDDSESGMSIFEMLNKAATQLESGNFAKITDLFNALPKMIGAMTKAYKSVMKSSLLNGEADTTGHRNMANPIEIFAQRIEPLFTAINKINNKIPEDISGLKRLKGIQKALGRIPTVINQLVGIMNNSQIGSINTATITSIVSKITEALNAFDPLNDKKINLSVDISGKVTDNASKPINDAYDKVKAALDKLDKLKGNHPVRINVNVNAVINGVDAAVEEMNTAARRLEQALKRLNAAKSGGSGFAGWGGGHAVPGARNGGWIRPLYRSHGGSIFQSRGTDTIPTMLTKGEFVINRMAASRIGDSALWKLNHMDIAGALRSLSARVGQSIAPHSVINNTNNTTRNATVNLHNYNGGSMGTVRAGRWAHQLTR